MPRERQRGNQEREKRRDSKVKKRTRQENRGICTQTLSTKAGRTPPPLPAGWGTDRHGKGWSQEAWPSG